jgi:hypothetical protein
VKAAIPQRPRRAPAAPKLKSTAWFRAKRPPRQPHHGDQHKVDQTDRCEPRPSDGNWRTNDGVRPEITDQNANRRQSDHCGAYRGQTSRAFPPRRASPGA